jgi:hypothetical protein
MPSSGGKRTLWLHTLAPPGATEWRIAAQLPDGTEMLGPTAH